MKTKTLKIILLSSLSILLLAGCSSKTQVNDLPNSEYSIKKEIEKKEIEKELERKLKEKWIKEGEERVLKVLKEGWADEIKRYELGIYLNKKGLVTAPQVIPINLGNKIQFEVIGCKLRKMVTVDDLLPVYNNQLLELAKNTSNIEKQEVEDNRSYEEYNYQKTTPIQKIKKLFPKTYEMKTELESHGVDYTIQDNNYLTIFDSKDEYDVFCNDTNKCK